MNPGLKKILIFSKLVEEIPSHNFHDLGFLANGLLGSYWANANWEGAPYFKWLDPKINFAWHVNPHNLFPFSVIWEGIITIEEEGEYSFWTESST